jgi:hypothetical protein
MGATGVSPVHRGGHRRHASGTPNRRQGFPTIKRFSMLVARRCMLCSCINTLIEYNTPIDAAVDRNATLRGVMISQPL